MRRFALLTAVVLTATLAFAAPALAGDPDAPDAPAAAGVDLSGAYTVAGANPGGHGSYAGTLTITKVDEVYKIVWTVGTDYEGTAILTGDTLAAVFVGGGGGGVVVYMIMEGGKKLVGQWVGHGGTKLGSETLIKQ